MGALLRGCSCLNCTDQVEVYQPSSLRGCTCPKCTDQARIGILRGCTCPKCTNQARIGILRGCTCLKCTNQAKSGILRGCTCLKCTNQVRSVPTKYLQGVHLSQVHRPSKKPSRSGTNQVSSGGALVSSAPTKQELHQPNRSDTIILVGALETSAPPASAPPASTPPQSNYLTL